MTRNACRRSATLLEKFGDQRMSHAPPRVSSWGTVAGIVTTHEGGRISGTSRSPGGAPSGGGCVNHGPP